MEWTSGQTLSTQHLTPNTASATHPFGGLPPLPKGADRPVHAQLGGEGGAVDLAGDVRHRALLEVAQAQDALVALGQLADERGEDAPRLAAVDFLRRVGAVGG